MRLWKCFFVQLDEWKLKKDHRVHYSTIFFLIIMRKCLWDSYEHLPVVAFVFASARRGKFSNRGIKLQIMEHRNSMRSQIFDSRCPVILNIRSSPVFYSNRDLSNRFPLWTQVPIISKLSRSLLLFAEPSFDGHSLYSLRPKIYGERKGKMLEKMEENW